MEQLVPAAKQGAIVCALDFSMPTAATALLAGRLQSSGCKPAASQCEGSVSWRSQGHVLGRLEADFVADDLARGKPAPARNNFGSRQQPRDPTRLMP